MVSGGRSSNGHTENPSGSFDDTKWFTGRYGGKRAYT